MENSHCLNLAYFDFPVHFLRSKIPKANESHQVPVAHLAANHITSKDWVYTLTRSLVKNSAPAQTHYDQVTASGTRKEN